MSKDFHHQHVHVTSDPKLLKNEPWVEAGVRKPDVVIYRPTERECGMGSECRFPDEQGHEVIG